MQAKDVMTVNVVSVEPDASILQAIRLMLQHRISGLPVVDPEGQLVGIVTEGDLLRRGELGTQRHRPRWLEFLIGPGPLANEYVRASGRKVHEIMTKDLHTVAEDAPLHELVDVMERQRIKRMPITRDGKLVGIVSRANLVRALVSLAREAKPGSLDDEQIRTHILAKLKESSWAPLNLVNIMVRDGVVQLWGAILDERQRAALIVVAENAPGVRQIEDHLVWIEPHSGMTVSPSELGEPTTISPAR